MSQNFVKLHIKLWITTQNKNDKSFISDYWINSFKKDYAIFLYRKQIKLVQWMGLLTVTHLRPNIYWFRNNEFKSLSRSVYFFIIN